MVSERSLTSSEVTLARPMLHSDDELLEVARRTLLEEGPGVSTAVIAERAGVSQATLFKRFGSKDALIQRALRPPERPPFLDMVESGPDKRPLAEQLAELLTQVDLFFQEMAPAIGMLRSMGRDVAEELLAYDEPPPLRMHRALSGFLRRATERGMLRELDHDAMAMLIMGSLHARKFLSFVSGQPMPGGSTEAYIAAIVDILLSGSPAGERS